MERRVPRPPAIRDRRGMLSLSEPPPTGMSPAYPAIVEVVSVEETSVCLRLHAPPENDASVIIGTNACAALLV